MERGSLAAAFSFLGIRRHLWKPVPMNPANERLPIVHNLVQFKPFRINTYELLVSVENKRLTETLSPLESALTKNIGEGPASIQPFTMRPRPKYQTRKSVAHDNHANYYPSDLPFVRGQIGKRIRSIPDCQVAYAEVPYRSCQSDG